MEYCSEGDLAAFYTTQAFDKKEFTRIVSELLSAVTYLHAQNIAHRDLKPENASSTIKCIVLH
jgi:serine/threonine protein kinase